MFTSPVSFKKPCDYNDMALVMLGGQVPLIL